MPSCATSGELKLPHADSSIIWQNEDASIALLDIPRSIEEAQGASKSQVRSFLQTSEALQKAFPSNEPKSSNARNGLVHDPVDATRHSKYVDILQNALQSVRNNHGGSWCLPRPFAVANPRKRKHAESPDHRIRDLPSHVLNDQLSNTLDEQASTTSLTDFAGLVSNESDSTTIVTRSGHEFMLPPRSSYFLSDCRQSDAFRAAIRSQSQETGSKRSFDLIILDPPWPSRSVRRTHQTTGSTYAIVSTVHEARDMLLGTDLDMLMDVNGLVGIWITNKPSVRDVILGPGGIFESWNVELREEWLWLKTTAHGEPIVAMDGVWRKPYEVFLLGRRRSGTYVAREDDDGDTRVKRRIIVGVPDLHSRKPCLKRLIERMPDMPPDYRALEVFSRHLVAGWWSWGNECIKFNWKGYWRDENRIQS